jgi:hypothetical protein
MANGVINMQEQELFCEEILCEEIIQLGRSGVWGRKALWEIFQKEHGGWRRKDIC